MRFRSSMVNRAPFTACGSYVDAFWRFSIRFQYLRFLDGFLANHLETIFLKYLENQRKCLISERPHLRLVIWICPNELRFKVADSIAEKLSFENVLLNGGFLTYILQLQDGLHSGCLVGYFKSWKFEKTFCQSSWLHQKLRPNYLPSRETLRTESAFRQQTAFIGKVCCCSKSFQFKRLTQWSR